MRYDNGIHENKYQTGKNCIWKRLYSRDSVNISDEGQLKQNKISHGNQQQQQVGQICDQIDIIKLEKKLFCEHQVSKSV